ncbi:MAG: DUF4070 domain-containing protein [Acidobacteriota bacterium]
MQALLISPRMPPGFWSFEKLLRLIDRKTLFPPLGLVTAAGLLPASWELKLVDRKVRSVEEDEWEWADIVLLSGMLAQSPDLDEQIREAKARGKLVAVGGPYATATPQAPRAAGADFVAVGEGELTVPLLVEALRRGERSGILLAEERPDLAKSPTPRYDLLKLGAYDTWTVEFSRGCPYHCDFCDVAFHNGRKLRAKTPAQFLAELDVLYNLGWRRAIVVVDDNFAIDRRAATSLLVALREWQTAHRYPFRFNAAVSVELVDHPEILELMADCGFDAAFLGIETPDVDSLHHSGKVQNLRHAAEEVVDRVVRAGLRPIGGFMIGFDGEQPGAGSRITELVERAAVPEAYLNIVQALPHTPLWSRLEEEGRLRAESSSALSQTSLMNFVPTRPVEEIAGEYVDAFWALYDPCVYLDRTYRCFSKLRPPHFRQPFQLPAWPDLRAFLTMVWRQGVARRSRFAFWRHLVSIIWRNPGVWLHYLEVCGHSEHFLEYRSYVRDEVTRKMAELRSANRCAA